MDVLFRGISVVALGEKLLGKLQRQRQKQHQIRSGQPQLVIFVVLQPCQIAVPLFRRQLAHLVDGVGGGIAAGEHPFAAAVVLLPVQFVIGVAVCGIEAGGGIGVHAAGGAGEVALKIHPDQRCRGLVVHGKADGFHGLSLAPQQLLQFLKLGGLSAAVQSVQHDEFPLIHGVSPQIFPGLLWLFRSSSCPRYIRRSSRTGLRW